MGTGTKRMDSGGIKPWAAVVAFAALLGGCGAPAQELRYDLANPGLPYDKDRTLTYSVTADEAMAAARTALAGNGFRVGPENKSPRGNWFTAFHSVTAVGVDASTGVGVLVIAEPGGGSRVSVVSRSVDSPGTIHGWIAGVLKQPK